ncbi:MAG: tetratricopeptide repeat protein [bacterium]
MMIFFVFLQTEMFQPEQVLKFADHLYLEGDFSSALNEYRRYLFLNDSSIQEVNEKIVDCLIRLNRYDEAIASTKFFTDTTRAIYTRSSVYLLKGDYPMVRELLKNRTEESESRRLIGLSYAGEFDFIRAKEFIELPQPLPGHKSPLIGGLLALFPGGGHFYCKRIGDGIYSMLVIATGSLVAYHYYHEDEKTKFYVALGVSLIFYAGNIYGGINAVHNYNYYENERYRKIVFSNNQ